MSANGRQTIPCAFCKGKGTDPYDVLSWISRCEVCKGRGQVTVPLSHIRCAFCRGTGSHKTFSCLVCRGAGVVAPLPPPTQTCPACQGQAFESSSGLECLTCRGRGLVPIAACVAAHAHHIPEGWRHDH